MTVSQLGFDTPTSPFEQEVKWHPTMRCPECGDRMLWGQDNERERGKVYCRSALYMEGPCLCGIRGIAAIAKEDT